MDSVAPTSASPPRPGLDQPAAADEARLVSAILAKDRKATAEFVERYADAVYGYACSRLAPRIDLVDDLVQDVFLAAWEGLSRFRGDAPLQSWLLGIARHKMDDHYRSRLRQWEPLDETQSGPDSIAVVPDFDGLLDRAHRAAKTSRVLTRLPENYRLALLWRYWERVPAREMAARTGKTKKAVERLLARAREQFKQEWQRE